MSTLFSWGLRAVSAIVRLARRRPWLSATLTLALLVVVSVSGFWWYANNRWQSARKATNDEKFRDAQPHLDFCLKVWPSSSEVHLLAARVARRLGDLGTAEEHLNRCRELEKGATQQVQLEFLLLRTQAGEVDEIAPALFDLVDKRHPDSREILDTITRVYSTRLRYKPAYASLSKWMEVEPEYAKPYYWRGWVLERLNNQKAATADYHRALELDPDMVPARLRVAEMLLEDKQAPEALPHLERLLSQVPDDPQVQARMGICQFLQGNASEARKLMERAVVHLSNDPALLVTLANLDLQEGRAVEAEARLRTVLAADNADTEALFVLVSALQLQGRTDEAATTLDDFNRKREIVDRINDLLKDKADNPASSAAEYAEIGNLFAKIGRDKLSVYWLEQALQRDARCQTAHRGLAEHYERKGDAATAAIHRRQLTTPDPKPVGSPVEKKP